MTCILPTMDMSITAPVIDPEAIDMKSANELSAYLVIHPNWDSPDTLPLSAPAIKKLLGK